MSSAGSIIKVTGGYGLVWQQCRGTQQTRAGQDVHYLGCCRTVDGFKRTGRTRRGQERRRQDMSCSTKIVCRINQKAANIVKMTKLKVPWASEVITVRVFSIAQHSWSEQNTVKENKVEWWARPGGITNTAKSGLGNELENHLASRHFAVVNRICTWVGIQCNENVMLE